MAIKDLFEQRGITQQKLMEDLKVSQPYASALMNGKKSIGKKMAAKLNELYDIPLVELLSPDIDLIIKTDDKLYLMEAKGGYNAPKLEAVPLRLADPYGFEATGQKIYTLPDGSKVMQITVVPKIAWGSYPGGHADPEFYDGFETITVPINKLHAGTYLAFEMKGRSMVNIETEEMARKSLWPGQKIIGRDLQRSLWKHKLHIHTNDAWIIVHRHDGIMVKEIIDHDINTGFLTIHSWNPDKNEFPDRVIHIDDIDQLFNVVDPFGKTKPY